MILECGLQAAEGEKTPVILSVMDPARNNMDLAGKMRLLVHTGMIAMRIPTCFLTGI